MVGPGASSDGDGLLAEYGGVREEPSARERARRLGGLIVRSLRRARISAAVRDGGPLVSVAFRHAGRPYVMGLARSAEWELPAGEASVHETRQSAPGASAIVLSMAGFAEQQVIEVAGADSGGTVLWDRTHIEAVLCGLVPLPELLDASINAAFFRSAPYEPLARLLADTAGDVPPRMTTPDQLPPPWPVLVPGYSGIAAQLALTGEDGWPAPSGIACLGPGQLAVVTPAGLIELDTARGTAAWLTRLPGCANEPLVTPDGSVLALRGGAVARVSGTVVEAVGGEFDGSPRLLAGPGGEPWVLSGRGSDVPGEGTLALTRLGERPGDQHRYGIDCPGDVRAATWLGGLRFFLAAPGRSAVVDLGRSTRVASADWIESRQGCPLHVTVADPGGVVTAAGGGGAEDGGARVTLFRTDLRARTTGPVTELALKGAAGLCADADGTGYLLGDVSAAGATRPWPVLVSLPGLRPPSGQARVPSGTAKAPSDTARALSVRVPAQVVLPDTAFQRSRWDALRMAASGQEKDYELDPRPIDRGGQAEVIGARHRQTGLRVAFKRLRRRAPHTVARMRREIEAAQVLGGNPHVMPVLDYGPRHDWFVMPFADASAATVQPVLRDPAELRALVTAICEGLRHAHEIGWLHRDLKPANLLRLDGTWTVADWGLVRRPLGATTEPGRTRLGAAFGTVGFGAPELSSDPHRVEPQADVYSIGQIIGWAVTGRMPQANTPLLPRDGPWRQVVRTATQHDPARRPTTVDDLLQLVAEELDYRRPDHSDAAARLSAAATAGDPGAAANLFALAARYPDDTALYTQTLPAMARDAVIVAVNAARHDTIEITRAMRDRARDSGPGEDQAARITTWLHWIQARACEARDLGLLEEATRAVLAWDERWNQRGPRRRIARWLPVLRGDQAAAVARALRETPGSARHFTSVLRDDHADERVRRAIRAALNLTPAAGFATAGSGFPAVDSGLTAMDGGYVPARHQLPAQACGFVGRDEELARLASLLGTGRLVTVTGPGGAGKTRLALRAAAHADAGYRDGVCLIDLSGTRDPALLPGVVAAGLGLGHQDLQEVIGYLRDRELLLVLDGCDPMAGPCAELAAGVMRDTASVTVLATSERALNVTGERCLPVQPISVPGQRQSPLSADDPGAVFARCTPAEQELWQRLSVFSGLFDVDTADGVCADEVLDSGGVMEALTGLAAKSVATVHPSSRGAARYRLPDAYRGIGAERLAASGQERRFRGRHFACYQAMAQRFAAHFLDHDGAAMFRQLRASYPDVRAALEYGSGSGITATAQGPGAALGLGAADLAIALSDFWRADGQLREGRYWLGQTAGSCPYPSRELAQALIVRGHLSAAAGEARDAVRDIREGIKIAVALGDEPVIAQGRLHLTQALTFAEYYEEAACAGTEAYHLLREFGDDLARLRLQAELASLETLAGSPGQAVTRCENALRKLPSDGERTRGEWIRGYLHAVMAFAQFQQPGMDSECEQSTRTALRVYQEFGDRTGIAYSLELLAWLAARSGRRTRAAWLLGAADGLWEETGTRLSNVPTMEELHVNAEAAVRSALSPQRFAGVTAMGADSPLNEVIAFAIGAVSIKVVS